MDARTRELERQYRAIGDEESYLRYVDSLQKSGWTDEAERVTNQRNIRNLKQRLEQGGLDWDVLEEYNQALKQAGLRQCYCESSLCSGHIAAPGEEKPDPGVCLNVSPPGITSIEFMGDSMCDHCAQGMPTEYHLDDCNCTNCKAKRPKDIPNQVADLLDDDGDFLDDNGEPDPTVHGWHEDWESDEFEDEDY